MSESKIIWTDCTCEATLGCSPVSAGCANCFAERLEWRLGHNPACRAKHAGLVALDANGRPRWTGEVRLNPDALYDILRRRKPSRVFMCSRSDLFHEKVPDDHIALAWATMALAHWHTFQVLTKRSGRMRRLLSDADFQSLVDTSILMLLEDEDCPASHHWDPLARQRDDARATAPSMEEGPLPNVWTGVTVENRAVMARLDDLVATPAAVRWVSAEPLLEDLGDIGLMGTLPASVAPAYTMGHQRIRWVVPGGESGPGARACNVEWIRSIVKQCEAAEVAVMVKQLGSMAVERVEIPGPAGETYLHTMLAENAQGTCGFVHKKAGDPDEWPEDLRVRQYPEDVR